MRDHLQVGKAWSTDAGSIAHGVAVAREVVAVDPLGGLDQLDRLAGRYHRTPGHGEEVRDQGFDVLEHALARRRAGERVIGLVGSRGHVLEALADDAAALAQFLDPNDASIVGVAVLANRYLELEVLVTGIGACLAVIEGAAGRP